MNTKVTVKKDTTGKRTAVYIAPLQQNSNGEYFYENTDLSEVFFTNDQAELDLPSQSNWALKFFIFGQEGTNLKLTIANASLTKPVSITVPENGQQSVGWAYFRTK